MTRTTNEDIDPMSLSQAAGVTGRRLTKTGIKKAAQRARVLRRVTTTLTRVGRQGMAAAALYNRFPDGNGDKRALTWVLRKAEAEGLIEMFHPETGGVRYALKAGEPQ